MIAGALVLLLTAGGAMGSAEDLQQWLTYYYLNPRPQLLLPSLSLMDEELAKAKKGSLGDEADRGGVRTFYGKVLEQSDSVVGQVQTALPSLPASQQAFLREALRRCDTAACSRALGAKTPSAPIPTEVDPGCLDDLWAAFFATGDTKYVREIIDVLPWSEVRGNLPRLLTGGAARWSLASNAYQHSRVLALCEEVASTATGATRRILGEVISQAKAERVKRLPPEPK